MRTIRSACGHFCCLAPTEQKRKWLPDLVSGRKLAAFALTEPEAGSDAANVQTSATPSADGAGFVLNGEKRYITNGGDRGDVDRHGRTPVEGGETAITAFLVTPDMPGFQVIEPRMEKLGIRGTATARLAFRDMYVPRENILGADWQGAEGGAHGARFRPHDFWRVLHWRGENLFATRVRPCSHPASIRSHACRV